jgi:serine/threonine-protein kinase RsbW
LEILTFPLHSEARMAARCEMDLSPGTLTVPCSGLAGNFFIASILERFSELCLDSNRRKPLTYIANIVTYTIEFTLPSRIESVDEAALKAAEFARKIGLGDEQIFGIDLAIRESVANAVKHGNKFDESKPVELELSANGDTLGITVRDRGPGFAPDEIPDPTNPENLLKTNGRGILFMCTFMDEVEWSNHPDGGMTVKMLKKLEKVD